MIVTKGQSLDAQIMGTLLSLSILIEDLAEWGLMDEEEALDFKRSTRRAYSLSKNYGKSMGREIRLAYKQESADILRSSFRRSKEEVKDLMEIINDLLDHPNLTLAAEALKNTK